MSINSGPVTDLRAIAYLLGDFVSRVVIGVTIVYVPGDLDNRAVNSCSYCIPSWKRLITGLWLIYRISHTLLENESRL